MDGEGGSDPQHTVVCYHYRFIHSRPVDCRSLTLLAKSGVLAASQPAVICNTVNLIRPDQSFLLLVLLTDLHPFPLPPTPTSSYSCCNTHTCTRRLKIHICLKPPFMPWYTDDDKKNLTQSDCFRQPTFLVILVAPRVPAASTIRPSILPLRRVSEKDNCIKAGNLVS